MEYLPELMEAFDWKQARMIISGGSAVIDNVRKILLLTEHGITVDFGDGQLSVDGENLSVEEIFDGRICLKGRLSNVEITYDRKARYPGAKDTGA